MSESLRSLQIRQELEVKLQSGNPVKGFHGTSVANARAIEEQGITDHVCAEGKTRIWFWDEDVGQNAAYNGKRKARETGDDGYAVIEAELTSPQPDGKGRKQWLASSQNVKVTNITYHDLDQT